MDKTKTSKKRGASLKGISNKKNVFGEVPSMSRGAIATDYSPSTELKNRKFIAEAITDALMDGDADAVREILTTHLELVHKDKFYKAAGVSRRALFKLMEPDANPTLESLVKVCKALIKAA